MLNIWIIYEMMEPTAEQQYWHSETTPPYREVREQIKQLWLRMDRGNCQF